MKKILLFMTILFSACAPKHPPTWLDGGAACRHETIVLDFEQDPNLSVEDKATIKATIEDTVRRWNEAFGFPIFDFTGNKVLIHVHVIPFSANTGQLGDAIIARDSKTCGGTIRIGVMALKYWQLYAHELGHIEGLAHVKDPNSVMNPRCCMDAPKITPEMIQTITDHFED